MNFKAVIFDIDGTLLDTEQAILTSLQHTLFRCCGKLYSFEELHFSLGIPGVEALKQLKITDLKHALSLWEYYYAQYSYTTREFEDISYTLNVLEKSDVILGIVTSKTREEYHKDFLSYSISRHFNQYVCADDTKLHKPNPEPLLAMIQQLQIDPKDAIYIGDTIYDMECAQKAGVTGGLALWGKHYTDNMKSDWFLYNPKDIIPLAGLV